MKPLTIKQLLNECKKEIEKGHGDYVVMLSDDDEGNGYHYCWYAFTPIDSYTCEFISENVSSRLNTIILG